MIMRKLVTIRRIDNVLPIEGADAIELVKIDGWQCVAKVGEFKPGDLCVYFEIDSFLPVRPEYEFLRARSFKKMGEHEGFRIKSIRLRGQLSQGMALPVSILEPFGYVVGPDVESNQYEVTELLGVLKYEPPVPVELSGNIRGNFPGFIKKTDQERCQNYANEIFVDNNGSRYEITVKLDGTSFTAFYVDKEEGVCGRNWELKVDDSNATNSLVRMYIDSGLQAALRGLGLNYAVQGELMGPSIQKNREGLKSTKLFVFDIYDIDGGCYLAPHARHEVLHKLWELGLNRDMVDHVPVIAMEMPLEELNIENVGQLLAYAEGPSLNNPVREGLVFKRVDGGFSFKAISNAFLLKEKD
jgi:RNA ligase (TIGR02306 family)